LYSYANLKVHIAGCEILSTKIMLNIPLCALFCCCRLPDLHHRGVLASGVVV
jgi:hypothetical protein